MDWKSLRRPKPEETVAERLGGRRPAMEASCRAGRKEAGG